MGEKRETQNKLGNWLLILLAILGIGYLVAVVFGWTSNRLGIVEVVVLVLLLLILSGLVYRLSSLSVSADGIKLEVEGVKAEQQRQEEIIEQVVEFLIDNFLTTDELGHLRKLAGATPWPFVRDDTTSFFVQELRRLRSLDLIAGRPNKGVRSLLREGGDVKDHFEISKRGQDYLALLQQMDIDNV